MNEMQGEVLLYQTPEGGLALDVRLERDTVWLNQRQMAELFDKDTDTIGLHIRNVFKEGELEPAATTEESSVVQSEGTRQVRRKVRFYNLDVIISVGYRVKSLRGTQFRIWATNVLRHHLVRGYSVHERRLKDLNQAVRLIADVAQRRSLSGDEATALLNVVGDYAYALEVLDDYDHQRVRLGEVSPGPVVALDLGQPLACHSARAGLFPEEEIQTNDDLDIGLRRCDGFMKVPLREREKARLRPVSRPTSPRPPKTSARCR